MAEADKDTVERRVDDLIRERAYRLWENDEDPKKHADEYWDTARKQIEAEGGGDTDTEPAIEQSDKQQRESEDPQEDVSPGDETLAKPRAKKAK
jgi:predicted metal-dependent peptidase